MLPGKPIRLNPLDSEELSGTTIWWSIRVKTLTCLNPLDSEELSGTVMQLSAKGMRRQSQSSR